MIINASFLFYKPSQIAAASILLALRMSNLKDTDFTDIKLANEESL